MPIPQPLAALLEGPVVTVNVGLDIFAETLTQQGAAVEHVAWQPPGGGDAQVAWTLAQLTADATNPDAPGSRVDAANEEAIGRVTAARPVVVDLRKASDVWPDMGRRLLHAGPPLTWDAMCGPMRGAVIGALLFEGWADDAEDAVRQMDRAAVELAPCHDYGAVGPMAGVIAPSMSVWVVRNEDRDNVAHSNLNEGLGQALRFGSYGEEVIERLRWMEAVVAPSLRAALRATGDGVDLKEIIAQAVQMGDDVHNRNVAATSLLFRRLTLALLDIDLPANQVRDVLASIHGNDHFFLNLSMAAAKVSLDSGHGVSGSSVVTAMSRNGVEFGIRVSGTADRWFCAPAPYPEGLYFAGYSKEDANPDMGDSSIAETFGTGGFVMGAAPAMVQFVGGTPADALDHTREMYEITLTPNAGISLPPLNFKGAPTGIDVRKVLDTGIAPVINTGIAHREAGRGQVGAGIARAPMLCFEQALLRLAAELGRA